jgi:hypothetical protein
MENKRLRQLALVDLSISNFRLMRDMPERGMHRSGLIDTLFETAFLLVCLISGANRRFQWQKRSQLFIRTHNITLATIAAIVVSIVPSIGG